MLLFNVGVVGTPLFGWMIARSVFLLLSYQFSLNFSEISWYFYQSYPFQFFFFRLCSNLPLHQHLRFSSFSPLHHFSSTWLPLLLMWSCSFSSFSASLSLIFWHLNPKGLLFNFLSLFSSLPLQLLASVFWGLHRIAYFSAEYAFIFSTFV